MYVAVVFAVRSLRIVSVSAQFLFQSMEQCIRQNNAVEIYQGYFESSDDATRKDEYFCD